MLKGFERAEDEEPSGLAMILQSSRSTTQGLDWTSHSSSIRGEQSSENCSGSLQKENN
jgi:hypothetical protein